MTSFTATVIDTSGIQSYIFGSNRLRENIGASYLVNQATEDWVKEELNQLGEIEGVTVVIAPKTAEDVPPKIHPDNTIAAELIYTGGGNAVIVFRTPKSAKHFTQILSKRVLEQAPGLQLAVAHQDFIWEQQGSLLGTIQQLRQRLEFKQQPKPPSSPLLGLSVTADCTSTRLVAVGMSNEFGAPKEDAYLVSREVVEKLKAVDSNQRHHHPNPDPANRWLAGSGLGTVLENSELYTFPKDVDDLGRSQGESSYIAVVHADGNGMGDRFKNCGNGKPNAEYVVAIRKLSNSVERAGLIALNQVTKKLVHSIENGEVVGAWGKRFALKKCTEDSYYLPFRPLVYGGDDVTFVCDGRLGLELAALYLEEFAKQKDSEGKPFSACAGIAIVKTHYPFARAYGLSEALCGRAKGWIGKKPELTAMDWHIATSGLLGSIHDIREREYRSSGSSPKKLEMRPVQLSAAREWRTWAGVAQVIKAFHTHKDWRDRKNKILALREVLRQGEEEAVRQFLAAYRLPELPRFPASRGQEDQLARNGWVSNECGYFDAIEAMDFYLGIAGREQ